MQRSFWFNRMLQYWGPPSEFDLVDLVERARPQVVQIGSFGPIFYSLADTEYYAGSWVQMPVKGIWEGLAYWRELIPKIQERGAKVVGQFSFTYHYGDYERHLGWFAAWDRIWTPDLLGEAPCPNATDGYQIDAEGQWVYRTVVGRPWGSISAVPTILTGWPY